MKKIFNFILILKEENKRVFILRKRYPIDYVAHLIMGYIALIAVVFGLLDKEVSNPLFVTVGFLMWFIYGQSAVSDMSDQITGDAVQGNLEQVFLTPIGVGWLYLCRAIAEFTVRTVELLIILIAISFSTNINLLNHIRIPIFVPFFLTIIGLYGFGFILAGLTLIFKRVHSISNLLLCVLLFFTGAIFPLQNLPSLIQTFGSTLPLTQGLKVLRILIVEQKPLLFILKNGDLIRLIQNSGIYLILGIVVFKYANRYALRQGTIGHY